ncbi:MAG TPA: hypothetical protein DGH68_12955, partial [Bacteroidetes bacterium]|nr:hypothetical protein [Bacteroidota bacterium]
MKRRHNILLLVACCVLSVVGVQFALAQWVQVGSGMGQIWNIQINPTNQQIMYAASNTLGIYKSTDGGNTWAPSISGLLNLTVQAMAISGSNPNILFCGTTQTGASNGVYKSTDAGATWTLSNTGITEASIAISAIAIDPTNPNTVYITIFDGVTNATTG